MALRFSRKAIYCYQFLIPASSFHFSLYDYGRNSILFMSFVRLLPKSRVFTATV